MIKTFVAAAALATLMNAFAFGQSSGSSGGGSAGAPWPTDVGTAQMTVKSRASSGDWNRTSTSRLQVAGQSNSHLGTSLNLA